MRPSDFLDRHVHLVGVGGAGMSALARLLHARGAEVSGSDAIPGPVLEDLRRLGVDVWHGARDQAPPGAAGYVVRSAAVEDSHPEVSACRALGYESILYSEALGRLSALSQTLAVAGTHGKTSTTALTAAALLGGGIDASHVVGGDVPELGGSGRAGTSPWLVVEACEFDRSFLRIHPSAAALLNFDHDHFDCYPAHADLLGAYAEFAARVPADGLVIVPADAPDSVLARLTPGVTVRRIGFGPPADFVASGLRHDLGRYSFVPVLDGEALPRVNLSVPGLFQVHNALAGLALALWAGADPEGACRGLGRFQGVRRRFEAMTAASGAELVLDYAHHPAEIEAVVTALRQRYPNRRQIVVFQPHQHQRTRALYEGFVNALARCDVVLVADIYGARERAEHRMSVSAAELALSVREVGGDCDYAGALGDVASAVAGRYRPGDLVTVLGAGDIDTTVPEILSRL